MKLRIKGNSLRFRITPSEMMRLMESGRIEDTIHFTPELGASLTYVLQQESAAPEPEVRYQSHELVVLVPRAYVQQWANSSEVGIYATIGVGADALEVAVEKDFACLDKDGVDNADTFPNPLQGAVC